MPAPRCGRQMIGGRLLRPASRSRRHPCCSYAGDGFSPACRHATVAAGARKPVHTKRASALTLMLPMRRRSRASSLTSCSYSCGLLSLRLCPTQRDADAIAANGGGGTSNGAAPNEGATNSFHAGPSGGAKPNGGTTPNGDATPTRGAKPICAAAAHGAQHACGDERS